MAAEEKEALAGRRTPKEKEADGELEVARDGGGGGSACRRDLEPSLAPGPGPAATGTEDLPCVGKGGSGRRLPRKAVLNEASRTSVEEEEGVGSRSGASRRAPPPVPAALLLNPLATAPAPPPLV